MLNKTVINAPGGKVWGRSFAVLENRSNSPYLQSIGQQENVYVYATAWSNDTATLCKITFDENGNYQIEEQASLYSRDSLGQGQIKISPEGKQIVLYHHGKKQGFFDTYNNTEVLTLQLGYNGDVNQDTLTSHPQVAREVKYGSIPYTGIDFSKDSRFIYYNQQALVLIPGTACIQPGSGPPPGELCYDPDDPTWNGAVGNKITWQYDQINTFAAYVDSIGNRDLERTTEISYITSQAMLRKAREWTQNSFGAVTLSSVDLLTGDTLYTGYYPKQNHVVYPATTITEVIVARYVGYKEYELKDHLGNVRVVVSDEKGSEVSMGSIVGLIADTRSYSNYYAFGMTQPGRQYSSGEYRFGFNGKENDSETGWQDYGMRMYDARLGRFNKPDPISENYPFYSPYQFAANTPIKFVDVDGLETPATLNAVEAVTRSIPLYDTPSGYRYFQNIGSNGVKGVSPAIRVTGFTFLLSLQGDTRQDNAIISRYIIYTDDPASLPDDYLADILRRYEMGYDIDPQESKYLDEAYTRQAWNDYFLDKEEFDKLPQEGYIDPHKIRFTHDDISSVFKKERTNLYDFINDVKKGIWTADDIPAIRITEYEDKIWTLDNRRLYAFQQANKQIRYQKVEYEQVKDEFKQKFTTDNEGKSVRVRNSK